MKEKATNLINFQYQIIAHAPSAGKRSDDIQSTVKQDMLLHLRVK